MTDYMQHVPGRLRIRARTFRCAPAPRPLAAEIVRMALSVLVDKGGSYSLSSLLGTRA